MSSGLSGSGGGLSGGGGGSRGGDEYWQLEMRSGGFAPSNELANSIGGRLPQMQVTGGELDLLTAEVPYPCVLDVRWSRFPLLS
jgi:hypothetical protein